MKYKADFEFLVPNFNSIYFESNTNDPDLLADEAKVAFEKEFPEALDVELLSVEEVYN